jgi:hypothetical protein
VQIPADAQNDLSELSPADRPPSCDGRFFIAESSAGQAVIDDLFTRKFGSAAPVHGHHIIAWYRNDWLAFVPVAYLNLLPFSGAMLVGGGCTDGRAFEHMPPEHRNEIREAGGVLYYMLRFGFHRFAGECEAYFGHVGDPRAEEVDLRAGFRHTQHENLVAYFHKPITDDRKAELTHKVVQLGAF